MFRCLLSYLVKIVYKQGVWGGLYVVKCRRSAGRGIYDSTLAYVTSPPSRWYRGSQVGAGSQFPKENPRGSLGRLMLIKGNKHLIKMFESLPRNKVQIRMASVSGSVVHRGFWVDLRVDWVSGSMQIQYCAVFNCFELG